MEKKRTSGCRMAALIVAGLVVFFLVVVLAIFWLFSPRSTSDEAVAVEYATAVEQPVGDMVLDASEWESLKPLEKGDAVSLRHYLLMMEDPRATELARETFRERAEGAPVTWRMTLRNVRSDAGVLGASLEVPYVFESGGVTRSSALHVRAEFDESQREALIRLRQGDPVTVSGSLDPDGEQVRITGAWVMTPE